MENDNLSTPLDHMSGSKREGLAISSEIAAFLVETGKWAKFISILGFIGIGFMVIMAFFMGSIMSLAGAAEMASFPSGIITFVYLILGGLYFFPVYYLYKFSNNISTAIYRKDNQQLHTAFEYLKSHYKFIGILMIIILSMYALMIVGSIITAAMF